MNNSTTALEKFVIFNKITYALVIWSSNPTSISMQSSEMKSYIHNEDYKQGLYHLYS